MGARILYDILWYSDLGDADQDAKSKDYKVVDINKISIPTLNALARILQFSDHTNARLHKD